MEGRAIRKQIPNESAPPENPKQNRDQAMKIKSIRQFKTKVDEAFETKKTRSEAKACYDFSKKEYKSAEEALCAYAAANPDVFEGRSGNSRWGTTPSATPARRNNPRG